MIEWLKNHMLPCFYKQNFGIDCPGCGMQRAILALFKGNFTQSFVYYPPLIVLLILFGFTIIHLLFDLKNGASIIKWLFIISGLLMLINFVYKLIFVADTCCVPDFGG